MTSEAVEMSEQVPLKSDTDNKDTEATETAADTPKKGGRFSLGKFWHKGEKKAGEEMAAEKPAAEGGEAAAAPPEKAAKKALWPPAWLKKATCDAEGKEKKPCCGGDFNVNLENRDEHQTNEHLKLDFAHILAEPEGLQSWDCAWRLTARTFMFVRSAVYKLLALICALPCAILWGLVFALVTLANVWLATPLARALTIPALWLAKTWNFIVRSLLDPLFRSCGLCLSSIHMRRYGLSNDATVEMA